MVFSLTRGLLGVATFVLVSVAVAWGAEPLDVAPFGMPLPSGVGLRWEDPRELHRVVVHFQKELPKGQSVTLQYWGSRWPEQHLPKDRAPGGGDVGWMELGDWYRSDWRTADAIVTRAGRAVTFRFHPVNAREAPALKNYPAAFRYTLQVRIVSDRPLPAVERIQAFTDSLVERRFVRLVWKQPFGKTPRLDAFNGRVETIQTVASDRLRVTLQVAVNPDPNTYDRTVVTVHHDQDTFTFAVDDLAQGPLFVPHVGVAVLPDSDRRSYAAVAAGVRARSEKTLYDRVSILPEQTWSGARAGLPPKKSPIYYPLGLDGGRQRFRLDPDGGLLFRTNDGYLIRRPGQDTPRLKLEKGPVHLDIGRFPQPAVRTLQEGALPICETTWNVNGIRVQQTAFVTCLHGKRAEGPEAPADATAVFLARLTLTNTSHEPREATLPISYRFGGAGTARLRVDEQGRLWVGRLLRGQVITDGTRSAAANTLKWSWKLTPGESHTVVVKVPYVVLTKPAEEAALERLDFKHERTAVAGYWRRRLDEGARLRTPEPMLNDFYRSHAAHLLINCEREPASDRRLARVGSFAYGVYGNEACMMVVDLNRRGYHREAQACLDAWLHYQGTIGLPGDFSSQDGVLYGAGGYEAGGYNQHHGWILWCLVEHYRFTRDRAWLERAAPGIVKAADWIIKQRRRTANRPGLQQGLLPPGALEDIGDWWVWLSTNCYTWRGLDAAAWALEQLHHPEAARIRKEADAYHTRLLAAFRAARDRSPVVRLRDGTAVPHFPSHVQRRGRCFGWICETLEGALHLLITRAIDPHSAEATWIIKDYEDNLYLSRQYGYTLADFERHWFGRGGMSMQACLLLHVEPYLYRDDIKQALRAAFNALAVSYFPDVRMSTEHALPDMTSWRGDHFKTSDEANAAGWLRYLFVREDGSELLLGQAVPREWLRAGRQCGMERAATYFGPVSLVYTSSRNEIRATVNGPRRNPPKRLRLRFRQPDGRPLASVLVNGRP
ncbi:MAG TPA: hypothetical protein VFA18_17150, partial [Gemmataceae bacterium]|nr:hypothetical protein [Gemmataceae bacterium]